MFNTYAPQSKLTIYLRPEFVDDEMVELLSKANLKEVRIEIQTINKKIPSWIRSNSIKSVVGQLPKLSKTNVPWKAEFIIGLPGDDMQGLTESLDFAEKMNEDVSTNQHISGELLKKYFFSSEIIQREIEFFKAQDGEGQEI